MCGFANEKTNTDMDASKQVSAYGTGTGQATADLITDGTRKALPGLDASAQATQDSFNRAAADPGIAQGQDYYRSVLRGDYLGGSPQLNAQLATLDATGARRGADAMARARSGAALTGNTLSTAGLQALQAGRASEVSQANALRTQALAENYARERGYQNSASPALIQTLAAPGTLQATGMSTRLQPYTNAAQILVNADRAPQQIGIDHIQGTKKGAWGYLGDAVGMAAGVYGMVSGMPQGAQIAGNAANSASNG